MARRSRIISQLPCRAGLVVLGAVLAALRGSHGLVPSTGILPGPRALARATPRVSRGTLVSAPTSVNDPTDARWRPAPALWMGFGKAFRNRGGALPGFGPMGPVEARDGVEGYHRGRAAPAPVSQTKEVASAALKFAAVLRAAVAAAWGAALEIVAGLRSAATEQARAAARWLVVAAAVFMVAAPLPSTAVSICVPVPTPAGIGRACLDVGRGVNEPAPAVGEAPAHLNAQRTPTNGEGNVLSRAGIRPLSALSDGWARVQASARARLDALDAPPLPSGGPGWDANAAEAVLRRRAEDMTEVLWGVPNVPRSQLVAHAVDPVIVLSLGVLFAALFQGPLGRGLRALLLPHHKANHIVVLVAQVAVAGEQALPLSRTCRALGQLVHDGINPLRLTPHGVEEVEARPGAQAMAPAVRYAALLLRNATRGAGLVNGRVEVDAFHAHNETAEAEERFLLVQDAEQMRGLPFREFPHKPGTFTSPDANQCPPPQPHPSY